VGELLLLGLFDYALQVKAKWLTLEVRMSNEIAQALYRKYTFKEMGIRKAYYSDDKEDALVMWTDPLDSPIFLEVLETNRARLLGRLESNV
jgi:ribosomal-protein-alanine N-acetyltransferase